MVPFVSLCFVYDVRLVDKQYESNPLWKIRADCTVSFERSAATAKNAWPIILAYKLGLYKLDR